MEKNRRENFTHTRGKVAKRETRKKTSNEERDRERERRRSASSYDRYMRKKARNLKEKDRFVREFDPGSG